MLHIRFFGGFDLEREGTQRLATIGTRGQALLAMLVLAGGAPLRRALVAETFWPDSTEAQARTNLRRELHQLLSIAPEIGAAIRAARTTIQWCAHPEIETDVESFLTAAQAASPDTKSDSRLPRRAAGHSTSKAERVALQSAITLYRGELLPGIDAEWLMLKREELQQQFVDLLRRAIRLSIEDRDLAGAIFLARRWVRTDPLNEAAHAHLMELYMRQGEYALAAQTFHDCRSLLKRELDVEPGPELAALYRELADLAKAVPATSRMPTARPDPHMGQAELTGRDRELTILGDAWTVSAGGATRMVLIAGEPGVGKTRLAADFLTGVTAAGGLVARSRAFSGETRLAFDALRDWALSDALRAPIEALDPATRTEIARVVPELDAGWPQPTVASAPSPRSPYQRRRLFEAMVSAFTAPRRPTVLFLDDLQWSDADTIEWLRFLLRGAVEAPLLVLATIRPEEVSEDDPVAELRSSLGDTGRLMAIDLRPLAEEDIWVLARRVLRASSSGDPMLIDELRATCKRSGGNPLFVIEMVRALGESRDDVRSGSTDTDSLGALPWRMHAVIQRRIGRLSPTAQALLRLASAVGGEFDIDLLAIASESDAREIAGTLDYCWHRGLIGAGAAGRYDFVHDCIREAIYQSLGPAERQLTHQRLARALQGRALTEVEVDAVCAQLASQFANAGEPGVAARWHERAAAVATRMFAIAEAVRHLRSGLRQLAMTAAAENAEQRMQLLVLLSRVIVVKEGMAGTVSEGLAHQIEALLPHVAKRESRFQALEQLRIYHGGAGNTGSSLAFAEQLLRMAEAGKRIDAIVYGSTLLGISHLAVGDLNAAGVCLRRGVERTEESPRQEPTPKPFGRPSGLHMLLILQAITAWLKGDAERSRDCERQARAMSREHLWPYVNGVLEFWYSLLHMYRRESPQAREAGKRMLHDGDRHEIPHTRASGLFACGWADAWDGKRAGIDDMRAAIDSLGTLRLRIHASERLALLAQVQYRHRLYDDAKASVEAGLTIADATGGHAASAELHCLRGDLHLLRDPADDSARSCFRRALLIADRQGHAIAARRAARRLQTLPIQDNDAEVDSALARALEGVAGDDR